MSEMYVLDNRGEVVAEPDLIKWGAWMASPHARRIAWSEIGEWTVSTVFLGINHSFGHGPPVLWETMVFGPKPWDQPQWRYTSREAAVSHHDQVAEHIRRGGSPDDVPDVPETTW